jgi:site-specific DNA-methyltransferase (adenine-specific)
MARYDEEGRLYFPRSPDGRIRLKIYLDESRGTPIQDLWDDIPPLNSQAQERLGYPTQKPVALLERIIAASSSEGDLVLDPFCGCGTTVHAAEKLNRRWIGIDITHLAIGLVKRRLTEAFPRAAFDIQGVPKDLGGARELAAADKHQFQLWALSAIEAQPFRGGRKGADGGVDGYLYFKPDGRATEKAIVEVKGGANIGAAQIRSLIAAVDRERAKLGVFLTLEEPTTAMRREAAAAGLYKTEHGTFQKIQILTIGEVLDGARPHTPWIDASVFKRSRQERTGRQGELGI